MSNDQFVAQDYALEFTAEEWEEIQSLPRSDLLKIRDADDNETATGFIGIGMRADWYAVGYMCLGKAQRLLEDDDPDHDDEVDLPEWAAQLRAIAAKIFEEFKPGDGKI